MSKLIFTENAWNEYLYWQMKDKKTLKKLNNHIPNRSVVIWILLILGFCAVEFPGIIFMRNKVYPFILGMPFIYGYVICCWFYMCAVLFFAWRTRWGKVSFFKKKS